MVRLQRTRASMAWAGASAILMNILLMAACGGSDTSADEVPSSSPPDDEPIPEPQPGPKLGLNDVSVLMPIPTSIEAPGYMASFSPGAKGELLPKAVFDAIPLFPVKPAQGLDYGRMRVVAVRFDGCQSTEAGCLAQIRMVMQPIAEGGAALDSALHVFYDLDDQELEELTSELRRIQLLAPEVAVGAPLDVHAGLLAQGMEGAYGAALTDVVLRYTGEDNLSRMTFFLRAPPVQEVWFFGGFDRVSGEMQAMDIVGVGPTTQRVIATEVADGWQFDVTPLAAIPEDGSVWFSSASAAAATPQEREAAYASFLRVNNPNIHAADALSCAGCHLSTHLRAQAETLYGLTAEDFPEDAYASSHDLTLRGSSATTSSSLRVFGWFEGAPMIGRRVIHESAMVASDLEARFPAASVSP